MTVAGKLDGLYIIFGTHSSGNCQALTGLHVLDLKNAAYVVHLPGARRMTVAGKLDGLYIIVGNYSLLPQLSGTYRSAHLSIFS